MSSAFAHWMRREIHEQPETLAATLEASVDARGFYGNAIEDVRKWLRKAKGEVVIAASGSSRHAGLAGELFLEDMSGIAVDVEYASEYSYREERSLKDASVLVISQSGETADTLAALRKAKRAGHRTLAITNNAESSMAAEADVSFPTQAGRERAVPATKSFTAQLLHLYLVALLAAEARECLPGGEIESRLRTLAALPEMLRRRLHGWDDQMRDIAAEYRDARSFLFLGRSVHYAIAREGALKLKEASYVHAEGYPSGELKHGPNALVSGDTPVVLLATHDPENAGSLERYEKVVALMHDLRTQGATLLAVANAGDTRVPALAHRTVEVEPCAEPLLAMLEVVPLQMFAYWMAVERGIDVDNPRNLSKAVLSE